MKIKFLLTIILIFLSHHTVSQSNHKRYLLFNSPSNSSNEYEIGDGKKEIRKNYIKELRKNGDIVFYINDNMFRYYKRNEIDSSKIKHLKNINFSKLKSLKKKVNKVNPYYPYKVFPNLYLVEKINDSLFVKYEVKWEYYIK